MNTYYVVCQSPVGDLILTSDGEALTGLYMKGEKHCPNPDKWLENSTLSIFGDTIRQLDEYFAGQRTSFDLQLRPKGTEFQTKVWAHLRSIPFGKTMTYRELAQNVGRPQASRAVGQANGKNPISILVPCHRVIGSNGSLTGYGGGLGCKQFLLKHERSQSVG